MAKNFQEIYDDTGDSSAQNQSFFIKQETVRGVFAIPTGADFLFTLSGGSTSFSQPKFSSPHRSGRHHLNVIKEKTETSVEIPTYFNIDTTLGAAAVGEIDPAIRFLHLSLLGREVVTSGAQFLPGTPAVTATVLENGDKWGKQTIGFFVTDATMTFPGDGQASTTWSGMAKTSNLIGVGKTTTDNNTGNTVTLQTGEGKRFRTGGVVMLVEADGTTRSADTPDGSPRNITDVTGDVVTVDGAVLADADGSGADIFLAYYEPETPAAINDPQVGLQGSISITGFSGLDCFRSAEITFANNHELKDNCFGEEGLGGALFVPGGRLDINLSLEINMNHKLVEFLQEIRDDISGEDIQLILGDSTDRHLQVDMDRVIFQLPSVEVPESGSIPVTLESAAVVQSAIDAKDEISVHYK